MRMSDTVDSETMKVCEERVTSPKDNNSSSKCDTPPDCSHGNREDPGLNNKRDMQDGFPLKAFEKEERGTQDQAEKEDKVDKSEKPPRRMLSRDSSQDYTDSTGIDLHEFLVNTLKGNPRDRIMLLKLEQDILDFISNNETQQRKFPPMSSYHRMLLHRVAAYFGMDHNVDPSGKSVIINKTTNTRIPDQKFSEHIKDDRTDDFQKRYILKRDNSSFDREDSVGDNFILDRSAQDEDACMSTQQRRQVFRLGVGRSGASRQSSSETETLPRQNEPRPWSSTDSSDSSHRLAPRPPITKASSFSGISPGLVRGDSTASSKSTGRLSKTGSESCSSVGSSSSSLSRPQLPQIPASNRTIIPNTSIVHSNNDTRGAGHPEIMKNIPSQPQPPLLSANDATNYYILPLEASGIPPGSVLVNPHTGKPFIHPDGSAVVYNPATITPNVGRVPQQGKNPQQPIQSTGQPQPTNHLHSQPEALNAQFSQMSLSQPAPGDSSAPDTRHYPTVYHHHHHHAPPSMVLQGAPPPQQVTSYLLTGPSAGHAGMIPGQPVSLQTPGPNHGYSNTTPAPPAFSGAVLNQSLLQQHTYIQQPMQQVSTCYCASSSHPHCSSQQQQQQHYRTTVNPISYNCPPGQNLPQQQVHQAVMPNAASSYQSVPSHLSPLPGNQQSNMGNQLQGMMVQYPSMQAYQQVSMPQQQYQQPMFVSCQPGQGALAMGSIQPYYSLLPPNQHTTMSSTVSFLPAPVMEQLSFPQNSSPCVSQQHPGQQYTGLLPPATGSSMVMLQMTAPPCQQPRAPSPCQRKQPNHKNLHHGNSERTRRPNELQLPQDNSQSSLSLSPALTPGLSGQHPSIKGLVSGLSPITPPLMGPHHPHHHPMHHPVHTAFCNTGQGEAHYSLLGQPLQYKPSIRPPLIHTAHMVSKHQGPLGVWHSRHGRKSSQKPLSSELSVGKCREFHSLATLLGRPGFTYVERGVMVGANVFSPASMSG